MSGKGYPTQPSYPMQQGHPPPQQGQAGAPPPYSAGVPSQEAPPPYSYAPPPQQATGYYQYQSMQAGYPIMQQGYPMMMQQGYPVMPAQQIQPTGQTVQCGAIFDSGARFDGIAQPRIPPPPPGCPPNTAQMASMQGHTVVGSRQKKDWFSGGSGGGVNWGI